MSLHHPKNLEEFKKLIASDKLVVVDFHAQWCGPCKVIGPKFEKLSTEYTDIIFAKIDVDEAADVASDQSVRAMPTFMFFKGGDKVAEVVGANINAILAKIKEYTPSATAADDSAVPVVQTQ